MKILQLPTDLKEEAVGAFKITEERIHEKLGEPHYIETDEEATYGGHNHVWAYQVGELKFLLEFRKNYEVCAVYSEPPELEKVLFELLGYEREEIEYCHYSHPSKS